MFKERRRLLQKVSALPWEGDIGEEACLVSGAANRDGVSLGQEGEGEAGICVLAPGVRSTLRERVYTWDKERSLFDFWRRWLLDE